MIQEAKKEDLEAVYSLICELEQEKINPKHFQEVYNQGLESPHVEFYVYCHEEKVIGFISLYIHQYLHHHGNTGEIVELVVTPEYRGLRVGDRLLCHVEKKAKEKGLVELELSTSTYRKKAHRFYEAHGYLKNHYNYTKKLEM